MKAGSDPARLDLRDAVAAADAEAVRAITAATGFFRPDEVDVAVELVEERLARGAASGYHFVFADAGGRTAGYACFGAIACTVSSWDLYWIAVHPDFQGRGVGTVLIRESERRVAALGGTRLYVETSSKAAYQSTRGFYEAKGYRTEAVLEEFYAPGDGKVIFLKVLG
jgi:ribosomal protein S18 acetylase RimI-like enzyme